MSEEARAGGEPDDVARALLDLIGPLEERTRRRLRNLLRRTPAPAERVARRLNVASIDDHRFAKNSILSLTDIDWPNSIRYGFTEIADAVVTPFGFVIGGDHIIFDTQVLSHGWMHGSDGGAPELARRIFDHNFIHKLDIWRETCLLSLPADMEAIAGPVFLFNSRLSCFNFAHFVRDTLIQAPTFRDCRAHVGAHVGADLTPLLAGPGFPYSIMPEMFRRAVGASAPPPMFLKNRFFKVARLFVPTTHFQPSTEAIARGAVVRLARDLADALRDYRSPTKRRLFISRADSNRGDDREPRFANSDELARALAEIGIEPVVVGRLGVDDYFKTFVNAELVVGLHGAGTINVLMSEQPRMLEIMVPGYPGWNDISMFVETGMGAPFRRVVLAEPQNGMAEYDIPRILEACKVLLATPCPAPSLPL